MEKNKEPFGIHSHKCLLLPCVGICSIDEESGYCIGCSRTEDEVYKWEDLNTDEQWKKKLIKELKHR